MRRPSTKLAGLAWAVAVLCLAVSCRATAPIPEPTHIPAPAPMPTLPADWAARDRLFLQCLNDRVDPADGELAKVWREVVEWMGYEQYTEACPLASTWQELLESASASLVECPPPASPDAFEIYHSAAEQLRQEQIAADYLALYCTSGDQAAVRQSQAAVTRAGKYALQAATALLSLQLSLSGQ